MGFRENLKSEIEYQDLTVQELANKSGVSKRTLDHYLMTNPREPLVTNAVKIAKALNVSVEYLVTGIDFENAPKNDFSCFENCLKRLTIEQKKSLLEFLKLITL